MKILKGRYIFFINIQNAGFLREAFLLFYRIQNSTLRVVILYEFLMDVLPEAMRNFYPAGNPKSQNFSF